MNKLKVGRPVGSFKASQPARVGGKATKVYSCWIGMKGRCLNPNSHIWKYYGGRGITVCDRWLDKSSGFQNFLDEMGQPPPGTTLDRVDNSKGYSPDNCKWSTWNEQAQNRRKSKAVLVRDPNSLRQKAIRAGLPYSTVYQRYKLHGWSLEQALTTPHLGRGKPVGGWVRTRTELYRKSGG